MQLYTNYNLYKATIISLFTAIMITGFSIIYGKENLFLLLNTDFGKFGDFFFEYATYLGDGMVWVFLVLFFLWKDKKQLLLIALSIIISTIIVHFVKGSIFINQPRPLEALPALKNVIHTIPNVTIHLVGSFPSGHTTQAFTMYLLLCFIYNKKWMVWIGLFFALLVGYSRVYQAQHFPIDVAGGIVVAIITVHLSIYIVKKIHLLKRV
jgi:membrane-associated phospholipid phosphatase